MTAINLFANRYKGALRQGWAPDPRPTRDALGVRARPACPKLSTDVENRGMITDR
jgi:hypothetical protein